MLNNRSSPSIKEFGRDVTSDTEFPTRRDLVAGQNGFAKNRSIELIKNLIESIKRTLASGAGAIRLPALTSCCQPASK